MTLRESTERLVYFPYQGGDLAGILAVPSQPNGITVVLPWGSGAYPSSGRNRVRAYLARALASNGFHTFRFDKPGVGESDGRYELPELSAPQTEEIVAAFEWLKSEGMDRLAIVANCFGGWSSLMALPELSGLEAIAVVNSPVRRDHGQATAREERWRWWIKRIKRLRLRRLLQANVRARYRRQLAAQAALVTGRDKHDTRFADAVKSLLDRRIPVLLLYGTDEFRTDLDTVLEEGLREAIESADPPTRLVTIDERLQGTGNLRAQQLFQEIVVPWLGELSIHH